MFRLRCLHSYMLQFKELNSKLHREVAEFERSRKENTHSRASSDCKRVNGGEAEDCSRRNYESNKEGGGGIRTLLK